MRTSLAYDLFPSQKRLGNGNRQTPVDGSIEKDFAMKLSLKVVSGHKVLGMKNNKLTEIEVKNSDTIQSIKSIIQDKEKVSPNKQALIYKGTLLEDHKPLAAYKIEEDATLYVIFHDELDGLKICINMTNGKIHTLDVKLWYTIDVVKDMMEKLFNVQSNEVKLIYAGKQLEDALTLADYKINKDFVTLNAVWSKAVTLEPTSLDMEKISLGQLKQLYTKVVDIEKVQLSNKADEEDKMKILIRDAVGELMLKVRASDTVRDLKTVIASIIRVPPNRQMLFINKYQLQLEDNRILVEYDITENSIIWMLSPSLKLFIKMPQVGTTILLNVYCSNTIREIKVMVWNRMGIPCNRQTFIYAGGFLDDDQNLAALNIKSNSTFYIIFSAEDGMQELKLYINSKSNKKAPLKLKLFYTILDVKAMIEIIMGFPIGLQELTYAQQKLKDWRTLASYKLKNEYALDMILCSTPMQIFIKTPSQDVDEDEIPFLLEVVSSDSIDEVMAKIPQDMMDNVNGQPCLFLDEIGLAGNQSLAHYNIQSGALLYLERLIQVNVQVPSGEVIVVDLKVSDTIEDVKDKIEEMCGVPWQLQTLTYLEDELDDSFTLKDYEDHLESLWELRWWFGNSFSSFFWPTYMDSLGN